MMCVTPPVTASKERQTSAKSCKAGKVRSAHGITLLSLHEYRLSGAFLLERLCCKSDDLQTFAVRVGLNWLPTPCPFGT